MQKLIDLAAAEGIHLTDQMAVQFTRYREVLLDWNTRINLTAITDPDEILIKHFLDSLLLLNVVELAEGSRLIDIGAGAGFPSIPLKIARPSLEVTLLDSLRKRTRFLAVLLDELGMQGTLIHSRAEDLAREKEHREQYDLATARAVAALPALCEFCLPFVRVGGVFAALKGGEVTEEVEAAAHAIEVLGGRLQEIKQYSLPDGSGRSIVLIEKISHTSSKYPRSAVKITKTPL